MSLTRARALHVLALLAILAVLCSLGLAAKKDTGPTPEQRIAVLESRIATLEEKVEILHNNLIQAAAAHNAMVDHVDNDMAILYNRIQRLELSNGIKAAR